MDFRELSDKIFWSTLGLAEDFAVIPLVIIIVACVSVVGYAAMEVMKSLLSYI